LSCSGNVIPDSANRQALISEFGELKILPQFAIDPSSGLKYLIGDVSVDLYGIEGYGASVTSFNEFRNEIVVPETIEGYPVVLAEIYERKLTSLDLSKASELRYFECIGTDLTSLDMGNKTKLGFVEFANNDNLSTLDMSGCTALSTLECYFNRNLTDLNVNMCTTLKYLTASGNHLNALDVSTNVNLLRLSCGDNNLSSLDISKNSKLYSLDCDYNNLSSLDITKNPELTSLRCNDNNLIFLDVSKNPELTSLYCYNNFIPNSESTHALIEKFGEYNVLSQQWKVTFDSQGGSEVDAKAVVQGAAIGELPAAPTKDGYTFNGWFTLASGGAIVTTETVATDNVTYYAQWFDSGLIYEIKTGDYGYGAYVTGHEGVEAAVTIPATLGGQPVISVILFDEEFTSLDVSSASALTYLSLINNVGLTSLDVSKNKSLTYLNCAYNSDSLTSLNVKGASALTYLNCEGNGYTSIDLSENLALKTLFFSDSNITSLDVSKNIELTSLYSLESSDLASLNIKGASALTYLECTWSKLTSLDVSGNPELTHLNVWHNKLALLSDVGKNTKLTYLNANNNNLTTLDVSRNIALTHLDIGVNNFSSLDVSKNPELEYLDCAASNLTSLDVSKNPKLTTLICQSNKLNLLDVSANSEMQVLYCDNNNLVSLDISKNPKLGGLQCNNNSLKSLDVSKNLGLKTLHCSYNYIPDSESRRDLIAKFGEDRVLPQQWKVTFDSQGGSAVDAKAVVQGTAVGELPTAPTKDGYTFSGWFTAASGGAMVTTSTVVTGNVTYYAQWTADKPVSITVSYNANGGSVSPDSQQKTVGQIYGSLPTPTRGGYTFDGWYTSANGGNKVTAASTVTSSSNHTLYAHWTQNAAVNIVSASLNAEQTAISMSANNVSVSGNVQSVRFAVWGNTNGQNDLRWYTANKSGNNYSYSALVSNHKELGVYNVHAYATLANGQSVFIGASSVTVASLSGTITSPAKSDSAGTFAIRAGSITPASAFGNSVRVAVWSTTGGQDDIRWYPMALSSGTYNANINISNHKYDYGTYNAHVYATQKNGVDQFIGATTVTLTPQPASISSGLNTDQTQISIQASSLIRNPGIRTVQFAVWGNANGQNDLRWYTANKNGNNYSFNVPVLNHKEPGAYNIHVYATLTNGQNAFIGATTVTVNSLSGKVTSPSKNDAAGTFSIQASDIAPTSSLGGVRVAVWSTAGGQDDIRWYTMPSSSGTYNANINISNHKYDYGTYNAHVYATQKNGVDQFIGATTVTLTPQPASISSSLNADQTQISIQANSVIRNLGIRTVQFAVWGNANGQNDLRWYTANKSGNNYSFNVPVLNHKEPGVYNIHVYATLTNGQSAFIGATTVTVQPLTGTVTAPAKNESAGTFTINASNISPTAFLGANGSNGVNGSGSVRVAVWSAAGGQDDIHWYPMPSSGGTYNANINISNHKYDYGTYNAHVYATQKNGVDQFIGAVTVTLTPPAASITSTLSADQTQISVAANDVVRPGVRSVQFAVWGAANGQNDLRWYPANRSGSNNSNYLSNVLVSNHRESGTYNIHAYATLTNGALVFIGASTVTVQPLTGTVSAAAKNESAGTFTISAADISPAAFLGSNGSGGNSGANGSNGNSNVRVAIWSSTGGQDDLRWYPMTLSPAIGAYTYSANIANHKNARGAYNAHVYATQKNGVDQFIGSVTVVM
jgi:uncharacterized repeat protein (TIGR02543 family)